MKDGEKDAHTDTQNRLPQNIKPPAANRWRVEI